MTKLLSYLSGRMMSIQYTLLVLLLVYFVVKGIVPGWNTIVTDFPNYYVSAQVVTAGEDVEKLYDDLWFQERINDSGIDALGKFSPQPPIAALTLIPLTYFSPIIAKRIWLTLSLLFMMGIIFLIHKLYSFSILSSTIVVLFMGRALSNDLYYGQLYLFVTFLMLFGLWLMQSRDAQILAGVVLTLAAVLKYFPVIIILYAFFIKKYKVVLASLGVLILLGVFQLTFFGWEVMEFYIGDILPAHLAGDLPGQGAFAIAYQAWPSFFNNLFVYNTEVNPDPIYSWATGKTIGIVLVYASVLLISSHYLGLIRKSNLTEDMKHEWLLALSIITGLVLLPATASYHFLFLIIPFCVLLKNVSSNWNLLVVGLIVAINFFPYPFASNENILMLILSYPRLLAISLLLFITYFRLSQQLKLEA